MTMLRDYSPLQFRTRRREPDEPPESHLPEPTELELALGKLGKPLDIVRALAMICARDAEPCGDDQMAAYEARMQRTADALMAIVEPPSVTSAKGFDGSGRLA